MGLKFARTFTQQALLDAWQEVRDSALADGRLDPELERFEADAARQVSRLAVQHHPSTTQNPSVLATPVHTAQSTSTHPAKPPG